VGTRPVLDAPASGWMPPDAVLRQFFRVSSNLACGTDAGLVTAANPAWERLLGWLPQSLLTRPFVELVHPEVLVAVEGAFQDALASGQRRELLLQLVYPGRRDRSPPPGRGIAADPARTPFPRTCGHRRSSPRPDRVRP
jgi:PAS domain-containing protein